MTTPTPSPSLSTLPHDWIRWVLSEVVVIEDPDTGVYSVHDVPSAEVGEMVVCRACSEFLGESSIGIPCSGEAIELPSP